MKAKREKKERNTFRQSMCGACYEARPAIAEQKYSSTKYKHTLMPFLVAILLCFYSTSTWAQIDMGGVSGTIKDPSGAMVSGVHLTLKNVATGVAKEARSSSGGAYAFPAVLPGVYTLKAVAPGFKTNILDGIQVHVQSIVTADVTLELGAVDQQVTVTSAVPLLQAQDASLGQTVNSAAVNDLPLNGRNWLSLASLSAGTYTPAGSGPGSSKIIANGAEPGQVDFRLNGINNNEEVFGGTTAAPIPDAIQEFKLQDGDNSAEFGHSVGAVVNAVTKAGTNQFHGALWEYFRNEALNANDFFVKQHHLRRQEYRQNQFGGTLGGPVMLPHYNGRDKTFFFVDYQRTPQLAATSATIFTDTIPTASMQSSGFQNLQDLITYNNGTATDALGRVFPHGTVLDPATTRAITGAIDPVTGLPNTSGKTIYVRDPFYTGSLAGKTNFVGSTSQLNMIPGSRIDPNAVKLLKLLPAPTLSGTLRDNYFVAPLQHTTLNQYDVRIDHTFSSKDSVFGVFSRSTADVSSAQPFPGIAGGALQIAFATTQPVYVLSLSETHVFSTSLVNEARFGIDHNYNTRKVPGADTMGLPAQYGIQGIPQIPGNGGLPTFNISGFSAFGGRRYSPTIQTTGATEYIDNLTKLSGNHELKFGGQLDLVVGNIVQPAYSRGNFSFNGQYSDIPNQNSQFTGIADMLLVPTTSSIAKGPGVTPYDNLGGLSSYNGSNFAGTNYSSYYIGLYGQDRWKVTPDLTLSLGLRWDYFSPFTENDGRQANLMLSGGNGSTATYYMAHGGCNTPRSWFINSLLAGYNIPIVCRSGNTVNTAQKTNFAPRLGVAYRLSPRLVVRSGFGIAYGALDSVGYGGTLGTNYPFQFNLNSPSTTSLAPLTLTNGQTATIENTFGTMNLQDPTQLVTKGLSLSGKQYNYKTPYTESLNLTVQYQFTARDSIQAGYVATLGRHLDSLGAHNSPTQILPVGTSISNYLPFPNLAANSGYLSTNAVSNYQSLQTVYQHQFAGGLGILANYTYGKCMSNDAGKGDLGSGFRAQWLPGFGVARDYTLCGSDATHVAHLSGQYALPFGRGNRYLNTSNRLVDALIGGWHFNFIYVYQSGQPVNVGCPYKTTEDFGCNANLVAGQNPYAGPHNYTQWLNPAAFSPPPKASAIGQTDFSPLGSRPQQVRGPGLSNLDSSIFKRFATSEKTTLEFRLETFNTLNSAEFGNPGQLNFTTSKFSAITSTRNNPRLGQLALKWYY